VEDVGRFDVSVEEACLVNVFVAEGDLPEYFYSLVVVELFALFYQRVEVTLAQLGNNVGVVLGGVDVMQMKVVLGMH